MGAIMESYTFHIIFNIFMPDFLTKKNREYKLNAVENIASTEGKKQKLKHYLYIISELFSLLLLY